MMLELMVALQVFTLALLYDLQRRVSKLESKINNGCGGVKG